MEIKGKIEREQTYTPIINALLDYYKDVPQEERLIYIHSNKLFYYY